MKVDITSMFFNSQIEGQTATPAWGTSIGQSASRECRIDTWKQGVYELLAGMIYKIKTDTDNLDISKGSSNRELLLFSHFDNVFLNGKRLDDAKYTLILVKELSKSHFGRLIISYAPYIKYSGIENSTAIELMRESLGCTKQACWFVYDISIINQDELHFEAIVVDSESPKIYKGKSQDRSKKWNELIETASNRSSFKHLDKKDPYLIPYLTAIRTKPFILLAGISGTGKSRIVRKLAQATDTIDNFKSEEERWTCHRPQNFELIQVKPNWHNSMDVVGYFSNVSGAYSFTTFVEFIAKAWQHKDVPFFLCLDEMNLAPVEEYFAEFLSAVESRSIDSEGNYWSDPIIEPFKDFGDGVCSQMNVHLLGKTPDNDLAKQFNEKGLTLPPNLIVMGTVNMDETTFSFSRKVLDRAMSIEMNEVDYDKFLTGETENDIPVLTEQNELLVNRPIKALDVKDEVDGELIIEYLKAINLVLDNTPFKLGYRAANEAILYVAAAKAWGCDDIETSLDQFTLMKILSRIEGDESKLTTDDEHTALESLREVIIAHLGEGKWASVKKIDEMTAVLRRDHFASYWS